MNYSRDANNLLKRLNNNPPLMWLESFSGIQFEAYPEEVSDALRSTNVDFYANGVATLEEFLMLCGVHQEEIITAKVGEAGWSFECMNGWGDEEIGFRDIEYRTQGTDLVFILDWNHQPCDGALGCSGYRDECGMEM